MSAIDFNRIEVLTFDTYGTLIDWERGILDALQPILAAHDPDASDDELLERYASHEAEAERGIYRTYREVLAWSVRAVCADLGVDPADQAVAEFAASVGAWPAFPDTAAALRRLAGRYRLAVITNCDDDLFAQSNRRLGVHFDWVVTAQQARRYKPRPEVFEFALARIGVPRERILHVAQSLYHDHVPAHALGIGTAWINRRHGRPGFGATPPATATPDLEVPDMRTFADVALGEEARTPGQRIPGRGREPGAPPGS